MRVTPSNAVNESKGMVRLKTERNTQLQLVLIPQFGLVIVLAAFCFLSLQALAQNDEHGEMTSSRTGNSTQAASNPGSASDTTDAEILQDLDRMRARIQELESRLKQRSSEDVAKDSVQPSS